MHRSRGLGLWRRSRGQGLVAVAGAQDEDLDGRTPVPAPVGLRPLACALGRVREQSRCPVGGLRSGTRSRVGARVSRWRQREVGAGQEGGAGASGLEVGGQALPMGRRGGRAACEAPAGRGGWDSRTRSLVVRRDTGQECAALARGEATAERAATRPGAARPRAREKGSGAGPQSCGRTVQQVAPPPWPALAGVRARRPLAGGALLQVGGEKP